MHVTYFPDNGYLLPSGDVILKDTLQTLIDAQRKSERKVTHKLTDAHINCHFSARQRVYLAVQVGNACGKYNSTIRNIIW